MLPWMIEKIKENERSEASKQIPLYLPLENPCLTGSAEQTKEREERGTVDINYSL